MGKELLHAISNEIKTSGNAIVRVLDNIHDVQLSELVGELVTPSFPVEGELRNDEVCFYQIKKLSYDEEFPQKEAFENVLMSLDNRSYNFVYILSGDNNGVSLYFGVVKNGNQNQDVLGRPLSASDYGDIVANSFQGNFNGSELKRLKGQELKKVLFDDTAQYQDAGVITGIPSVMELEQGKENKFQGIDRLVNSMLPMNRRQKMNWRMVVVCEPVSREEILKQQKDVYAFYNQLSADSELSWQQGQNKGISKSTAKQDSDGRTKTVGTSQTRGSSFTRTDSINETSRGSNRSKSTNESMATSHTEGYTYTTGSDESESLNLTGTIINKQKQELMKYIDEELLVRLKQGISRGWFRTSIYYMANKPAYANRLKAGIKALVQGNKSTYSPLLSQTIDMENIDNTLKIYQNVHENNQSIDRNALMLLGRSYTSHTVGLSTYLTPQEICVVAGLPQEEVPGIPMREGVSFALNEDDFTPNDKLVELGNIMQKERVLDIPFYLEQKNLSKHTFIAGVTGSGKTTTCHRLLHEAGVPFLVIEPAKTEYRTLLQTDNEIIVFSLGNEKLAPFRINPFELIPGENISAHIDMVKASFTSAFPMEGSMPQIMEEAIIRCYEKHGWSIELNENLDFGDDAYLPDCDSFPILSELLAELKTVVEEKKFGERLGSEYTGSLVSRISNLTVGTKGSMLNCYHSIDFEFVAKNKVILELEEMKSPEDKALIMGFILARLSTVVKKMHKADNNYRHLTLIEEAHRLLTKVEPNENGAKKAAVETFADLLAEVRKYGEGLIIVDQIPNKLAVEVLKNTNTKIIHRLLAKDDKDSVGDTMLMDEKQKDYLSALAAGETIIYAENTERPVQVKIHSITDTNEAEISEELIRNRFKKYWLSEEQPLGKCYEEYKFQPLYGWFSRFISMVKTTQQDIPLDIGITTRLKEKMQVIEDSFQISSKDIWQELIKYHIKKNGVYFSQTKENIKHCESVLSEIFTNVMIKNDISKTERSKAKDTISLLGL